MNKVFYNKFLLFLIISFIIVIDQFTKLAVIKYFEENNDDFLRINSFLNIVLVKNKGITFGLLNHIEYSQVIFSIIGIITIIYLFKWLKTNKKASVALALSLIIGGAIGNIIDRFRWDGVIDFLDFHLMKYHWYSFNIADSAICIGVLVLLIENIFNDFRSCS